MDAKQLEITDFMTEPTANDRRLAEIRKFQKDSKEQGGLITAAQAGLCLNMDTSNVHKLLNDGRLKVFIHFGKKLVSADQVIEYAKVERISGKRGQMIKRLWQVAKEEVKDQIEVIKKARRKASK